MPRVEVGGESLVSSAGGALLLHTASVSGLAGELSRELASVWKHRPPLAEDAVVVVDLDATLAGAHSEKEGAGPTFKRGCRLPPDPGLC